jgi:hypothetical protein
MHTKLFSLRIVLSPPPSPSRTELRVDVTAATTIASLQAKIQEKEASASVEKQTLTVGGRAISVAGGDGTLTLADYGLHALAAAVGGGCGGAVANTPVGC